MNEFYMDLQNILNKNRENYENIIMGDWNARIGKGKGLGCKGSYSKEMTLKLVTLFVNKI